MRKVVFALAGVLAVAGCGPGVSPVAVNGATDRSVLQAPEKKPTLEDLKGQIPADLSPEEATQTVSPQEGETQEAPTGAGVTGEEPAGAPETAKPPAEVPAPPPERTVQQRLGGMFRGGVLRGGVSPGGIRAGTGMGPGMLGRRHPGFWRPGFRHSVFLPRHRSFFPHRFWWGARWWRPFWRAGSLFYPVVYGDVPYLVQYCWNPALMRFTPCEVVAAMGLI